MKNIFRAFIFCLTFLLSSCYYDKYENIYGPTVVSSSDTAGIYSTNVQKIFNDYCVSCHNENLSSGGYDMSTWQGAHDAALSGRMIASIEWLPGYINMPEGGYKLDSLKIKAISNWINRGAPNN